MVVVGWQGLLQPWQERVLTDLGLAPKVNGTPYWPPVRHPHLSRMSRHTHGQGLTGRRVNGWVVLVLLHHQVKMSLGGPGKVDGRLLALLRVMYCRDRRLLAMSNVTYGALQAYNTPFRIATFERRAIMHALVGNQHHDQPTTPHLTTPASQQAAGPRLTDGGVVVLRCVVGNE